MDDTGREPAKEEHPTARPVSVAETTTVAEASVLEDALRNEGIEVFVQEVSEVGALPGFMLSQAQLISGRRRLLVPAEDAPAAERIIQDAILEARRVAIHGAFDAEVLGKILDSPWEEDVLPEMAKLREIETEVRNRMLAERTADWLVDRVDEVKIAQRLAVAGLTFPEARELVGAVVRSRNDTLQRARADRRQSGSALIAAGAFLLAAVALLALISLVSGSTAPLLRVPAGWMVVGAFVLVCTGVFIQKSAADDVSYDLLVFVDKAPDVQGGKSGDLSAKSPKEPKVLGKEDESGNV
jgi:hypothetical protein